MGIEAVTLRVVDALNEGALPYMLVGSFSSNFYGIPRSTKDADFVVELEVAQMDLLAARLQPDFSFDRQLVFETNTGTMKCDLVYQKGAFHVELFSLSKDDHDQQRWSRRRTAHLFGRQVWLPSPEDVIITKLRWSRSKDLDDARDVMAVQSGKLDWEYMFQWTQRHGTGSVLEKLRRALESRPL
jgi:hypothetical protein